MDQNDTFYSWYGGLQTGGLEKYFYILSIAALSYSSEGSPASLYSGLRISVQFASSISW
jgi:hypothetical protein